VHATGAAVVVELPVGAIGKEVAVRLHRRILHARAEPGVQVDPCKKKKRKKKRKKKKEKKEKSGKAKKKSELAGHKDKQCKSTATATAFYP
jgi:hypothetical protein